MLLTLSLAALALQTLPPPAGDRWHEVYRSDAGTLAIDRSTISRSGDLVRVLERTHLNRAPSTGTPVTSVSISVYDCRRNTVRNDSLDLYDNGVFLVSDTQTSEDVQIRADTPNESAKRLVCASPAG